MHLLQTLKNIGVDLPNIGVLLVLDHSAPVKIEKYKLLVLVNEGL
jgi:hypothetical protein